MRRAKARENEFKFREVSYRLPWVRSVREWEWSDPRELEGIDKKIC